MLKKIKCQIETIKRMTKRFVAKNEERSRIIKTVRCFAFCCSVGSFLGKSRTLTRWCDKFITQIFLVQCANIVYFGHAKINIWILVGTSSVILKLLSRLAFFGNWRIGWQIEWIFDLLLIWVRKFVIWSSENSVKVRRMHQYLPIF